MKKLTAAVAAAVAVFALAALSGVALAGDHGDHGSHGQGQKAESAQNSSSDSQAGIKPSDTTDKNTSCTTGGGQGSSATCTSDKSSKPDASKQYGNGQTAAQIANGKGAPSGTPITGPGNSQPHKICGRDVHAYKGGDCSKQEKQQVHQPQQQQLVTFCDMESATSGKLETKNAAEVAQHEFNGSPEENRDIVPPFTLNGRTFSENWASGEAIFNAGCHLAPPPVTTTTTLSTTTVKACEDRASESTEQGESKDDRGKGDDEHRKAGDVNDECKGVESATTTARTTTMATTTTTPTTTTPPTSTSTVAATTTVATTTTVAATTTTTAAAAAIAPPSSPSSASGVKGASKTIAAPAAASSKPSSGILGTAKALGSSATTGTLPFTGLRLWIVELIALGLIGSGVAMRLIARRRLT